MSIKLTKEEQEIENAIEAGEYESVSNLEEWKDILSAAAVRTLDKLKKQAD